LLADCYEAFIGALFLDQGIEAAREFIKESLLPTVTELVQRKAFKDPKSLLQEYIQAKKQNSPIYKVLHEEGPPHAKIFTVGVYANDTLLGQGQGKSKQEAEVNAASEALTQLKQV
jgi:ribonuclease-3